MSEQAKSSKNPVVALLILVVVLLLLNLVVIFMSWQAKSFDQKIEENRVGKSITETYSDSGSLDDAVLDQAAELERNATEAYVGMSQQMAYTAEKLQESAVIAIDKLQLEVEKTGQILEEKTADALENLNTQIKQWNETNQKVTT